MGTEWSSASPKRIAGRKLTVMIIVALVVGFIYGYISVKGQFCMNSGFSNVVRSKDTTKLKSFLLAILNFFYDPVIC